MDELHRFDHPSGGRVVGEEDVQGEGARAVGDNAELEVEAVRTAREGDGRARRQGLQHNPLGGDEELEATVERCDARRG